MMGRLTWALAVVLAGAWTAWRVPVEWVPQVELPIIRIAASWPGASPRAVETFVAAPIERAVQHVTGTASVESLSEEGRASITLEVAENVDVGVYVAQVNEQLVQLREILPDRVRPRLTKQVPEALRDEQGFMTIQLVGGGTSDALRRWADERIAPRLRSVPGVAEVVVEGGTEREVLITLHPSKLAAYHVDVRHVRQQVAGVLQDGVYGRLQAKGRSLLLLSAAEQELERLQQLVVRNQNGVLIRLKDVADVTMGAAPARTISRIDGQHVITLTIDRARGSHLLRVAGVVQERLRELQDTLPPDARLLVADDKSKDVRAQLYDIRWRGGLGLALVLLALLVMLKSVRASLMVVFVVSVALAVAFLVLEPLGLSLNLLTIAGLVLVFGLLVDNAVIVVEQLQKRKAGANTSIMQTVGLPLVGGTLSTMAVLIPLVYLSGELRTLFLPFGLLVCVTLGASLVASLVVLPVMEPWLPPAHRTMHARSPRWVMYLSRAPYRWVSRFPRLTLLLLMAALGLPLWLLPTSLDEPEDGWPEPVVRLASLYNATVGSSTVRDIRTYIDPALGGVVRPFIRKVEFGARWNYEQRPEAYVRLGFPPGNPIDRTDALIAEFEQIALASSAVSRTLMRASERTATLRVQFTEASMATAEPYLVREQLIQRAVLLAGIQVSVGGLLPEGYFSGSGSGISGYTLEAYGPNYEQLEAVAEQFAERLKQGSRRVAEVNTNAGRFGRNTAREVLRFRWEAEAEARTGVSAQRLAATLRPRLATRFPSFYADLEGETRLPIRLVVDGADETDVARLIEQPLVFDDSTQLQLAGVASYTLDQVPSGIERYNQQYKRYIRVDYRGPSRMAHEFIQRELDVTALPPGYRLQSARYSFFTEEVQAAFGWVILGTIALVFLITAAVFESWRLPLVVMLSVPLAAIGVALGFLWSGANFAEGAFIGVVLLLGVAVNDSILLTDRYQQLRRLRPRTPTALLVRLAVRDRLRPMWTTTLTSVMTLLPLLVFPDDGDFWMGLAVTVTGGLLASTLLAPLATVALLSWSPWLAQIRVRKG